MIFIQISGKFPAYSRRGETFRVQERAPKCGLLLSVTSVDFGNTPSDNSLPTGLADLALNLMLGPEVDVL
jgi:hypothetical protein